MFLDKTEESGEDLEVTTAVKLRKRRIPHSRADLLNKIELLRIAEDDEEDLDETDEENDDSEYDFDYSDDLESEDEVDASAVKK